MIALRGGERGRIRLVRFRIFILRFAFNYRGSLRLKFLDVLFFDGRSKFVSIEEVRNWCEDPMIGRFVYL